ncbi:Hypothetical protein I595_525 [Croceitalea dokdonensis DOKDO 023]|uniref:Uncharacterized protein n=1 Tax=Croceitalea dokdonensis DOKDO 023 TaxID=1300341 RepID=A0A0P7B2H6_9FLAO|nr:Hypothetical protein I595_525 [Croceitalea dokdonensis DOKDO 023]
MIFLKYTTGYKNIGISAIFPITAVSNLLVLKFTDHYYGHWSVTLS